MNNNCNNPLLINPMNFLYQDCRCNTPCKCKCSTSSSSSPCSFPDPMGALGCLFKIKSECVLYSGANLGSPTNIQFGDTLNTVINKLITAIGSGSGGISTVYTQNSSTINFSGAGTLASRLSGVVRVSASPNNSISAQSDGLYSLQITQGAAISITSGGVLSHADTSTQASVTTTGAVILSNITVDTFGHITGLTTRTLTADDLGIIDQEADFENDYFDI